MRSPAPGTGRSNSAVERAIQHHTTQVNSSSAVRRRSASRSAIATASLPWRRTSSRAASQIFRSLVIASVVITDIKPVAKVRFHQKTRGGGRPGGPRLNILLLYCASILHPACARNKPSYNPAMADLFDTLAPGKANGAADSYSAKDIEILEGLEPVRRRPGMYVGGTDERALHH